MNTESHDEPAGSDNAAAAERHQQHGDGGDGKGRQLIVAKVGRVVLPVDSDAGQPGEVKSVADVLKAAADHLPVGGTLVKTIADWLANSPVFIEVFDHEVRMHAPAELIDDLVAKGAVIETDWPHDDEVVDDEEWHPLGKVTIDTASLMLVDPAHTDITPDTYERGEFALGTNLTGVITDTGMGDGRYLVEGRYADCLFGRRLAEVRVCFLDDEGNWLGGDVAEEEEDSSEAEES